MTSAAIVLYSLTVFIPRSAQAADLLRLRLAPASAAPAFGAGGSRLGSTGMGLSQPAKVRPAKASSADRLVVFITRLQVITK
jgi:hypothetical protein